MNSTSVHKLNADKNLHKIGKIAWWVLNLLNNNYFPNSCYGLHIESFCPNLDEQDWGKIPAKASPSRSLSDLFWLKLDWEAIKSELGSINIFDTGAGRGGYAIRLNEFADGITTYLGVDVSSWNEWNEIMREFNFVTFEQRNSNNILDVIPAGTNFFISQSAIEHFESDLLYFRHIKAFIDRTNNNTVQIHVFPSAACLELYRWHGVRQYTPRTILKIAQLFDSPNSYSILFKLGGSNCNKLHNEFITHPVLTTGADWRDTKTEEYRHSLKEAVERDIRRANSDPAFYALVVHSGFNKPVFQTMPSLTRRCLDRYVGTDRDQPR